MNFLKKIFSGKASRHATPKDIRARFEHLAQPAVHLRLAPETAAGFSKLGGLPLLPPDAVWPEWQGKPLSFLAQIDLAEINACVPSFLPKGGCLYFFYDQEQSTWGFDPKDAGSWRVLHTTAPRQSLAQRPAPAGLNKDYIYNEKLIAPHRINILSAADAINEQKEFSDEKEFIDDARNFDSYCEYRDSLFEKLPPHQMLGHASSIQHAEMDLECQLAANGIYVGNAEGYQDPRVETLKAGAADWKLLLQLDSDDDIGWMWGDVGRIPDKGRKQDAARADFNNVWMILQCG